MTEFSQAEVTALAEFREKVKDLLENDYTKSDDYLIRWLRARDLKVDVAEEMLRNHFNWRKENRIDNLLETSADPYFAKNFHLWLNGVSLNGNPVLCIPMGEWDIRKIAEDNKIPEFQDFCNRLYERIVECIVKYNEKRKPEQKKITGFTGIVNWEGFSVMQTANMKAVQALLNATAIYEAHYPEIMAEAFFINTNPVFQVVFALMKPILAPRTLSKIACYGTDRAEWEPAVRASVDETQIPRQFGG